MLVSILMPVRNESKYISLAIGSVLGISAIDFELIVVDDGSSDNTKEIIQSFTDPKVKLIEGRGEGKVHAFNSAFAAARGDFFILFAGDDLIESSVVSKRVEVLQAHDKAACISFCKVRMLSDDKKYDGVVIPKSSDRGAMTGGGMAFNRTFAECVFPIPSDLPNEDSWIKHFVEFMDCKIFHVPEIGLHYRIHSSNSMRRDVAFIDFSTQLARREKATEIFLHHYKNSLSAQAILLLTARLEIQGFRQGGKVLSILLASNVSWREKLSACFYSNRILYNIRQKFYSFFSGR